MESPRRIATVKAEDLTPGIPFLMPGDRVWHRIDWLGAGVVLANDPETNEHPIVRWPRDSDTGRHVPAALLTKRRPLLPWRWWHEEAGGSEVKTPLVVVGGALGFLAVIASAVVLADLAARGLAP